MSNMLKNRQEKTKQQINEKRIYGGSKAQANAESKPHRKSAEELQRPKPIPRKSSAEIGAEPNPQFDNLQPARPSTSKPNLFRVNNPKTNKPLLPERQGIFEKNVFSCSKFRLFSVVINYQYFLQSNPS